MARRFTFYFPARTLVLVMGEVLLIIISFVLATMLQFGERSYTVLNYENGLLKIGVVAVVGLLCMYYLDLYDPQKLHTPGELTFRLLVVIGTLSLVLGILTSLIPSSFPPASLLEHRSLGKRRPYTSAVRTLHSSRW